MIKTDAKSLWTEVEAATKYCQTVMDGADEIRLVYKSQYFRKGFVGEPSPLNFPFEYISSITPAIVFDNPTIKIKPQASGVDSKIVKKMEFALNQWAKQDTLWADLQRVWVDVAMGFGVMHTYLKTVRTMDGEDYFKICSERLAPRAYFHDARAGHWNDVEFAGHVSTRSKQELSDDPAYDKDAVAELQPEDNLKAAGINTDNAKEVSRDDVLVYQVWVRHAKDNDVDHVRYNGMIFELGSNGKFIRKPRPYFGPEWGPYAFFGAYVVPDESYPLSPIGAIWDQVKEANKHAVAVAGDAGRRKSIVLVDATAEATAQKIRKTPDGEVILVDGLRDGKFQQVEFGGVTELGVGYLDRMQVRLDKSAGLGDSARGIATGKSTATEAADAASQRDAKTDYIAQQFRESTCGVLYTVAWYMWHSSFVRIKLSPEAALALNPRPSYLPPENEAESIALERGKPIEEVREALKWEPVEIMRGGVPLHGGRHEFDDLMLEISPFSMERQNEPLRQKRATEFVNLLTRLAEAMARMPWIKWDEVLRQYGDAFNRDDIDEIIDKAILKQAQDASMAPMQAATQQAQMQEQAAQQAGALENAVVGAGQELAGNLSGQALNAAAGVA